MSLWEVTLLEALKRSSQRKPVLTNKARLSLQLGLAVLLRAQGRKTPSSNPQTPKPQTRTRIGFRVYRAYT